MKTRIRVSLVFTAFMVVGVAVMLVAATGYPSNVKVAPYTVGFPTLALLLIILLGELHPGWKPGRKGEREGAPEPQGEGSSDFASWGPVLNLLAWILGYYVVVFLLGFMAATPVFLAAFLRRKAGVGWIWAVSSGILVTLLLSSFIQGLFKIPLWLGAIPRLIPGIVGGSIVPPL